MFPYILRAQLKLFIFQQKALIKEIIDNKKLLVKENILWQKKRDKQ